MYKKYSKIKNHVQGGKWNQNSFFLLFLFIVHDKGEKPCEEQRELNLEEADLRM